MTAQNFSRLPPAERTADQWLLDGELMERRNGVRFHSPAHAGAVVNVSAKRSEWCRENDAFRAFGYGCPYLLSSGPDCVVTFDAGIVRRTALSTLSNTSVYIEAAPTLAVEVIELDDDVDLLARMVKSALKCGVGTVWLVDPYELLVVVHRRDKSPVYLRDETLLSGGEDLPGFRCAVAEIFE